LTIKFSDCKDPKLLKFQGKPRELSPRARFLSLFSGNKPFDRHDWTIDRCGTPVRYILDYYSGPDEEISKGFFSPTFYVDVRPALDSPTAAFDRTRKFFGELYDSMFGSTGTPAPANGAQSGSQ
jgi:cytochrome c heme-lyase